MVAVAIGAWVGVCVTAVPRLGWARNPEAPETSPPPGSGVTFLDHDGASPFWLSAQVNAIFQAHPNFNAPYSGPNSLRPEGESAISGVLSLYLAWKPHRTTELILDAEMALGGGLSSALGVAGFTNLDVVRNPSLSSEPYLSRIQLHQIIPLSSEWEDNQHLGPTSSFDRLPRHRIELRAGRLSTADLFDINPAASDSHLQFMNWAVDNNGAYDYAADTRGYTYGLVVEYQGPVVELRFGEMLLPKVANGIDLEWDLTRAHAENLELEVKYSRRPGWRGTLRLLGFMNHANMGVYEDAIADFRAGKTPRPDITAHAFATRVKYGVGANLYQEVGGVARFFLRAGWNDGATETWAYTEIDDTVLVGFDVAGTPWRRGLDRTGIAFVTNGLSASHREYLRLGGLGFLLGDGNLRYARETIVEWYYNVHIWRGAFLAPDVQYIGNPGYNQDRGPVWVMGLRGHLEF